MRSASNWLRGHRASMLELAGLVLVAIGAGLIYLPAGLIAGGISAVFVAQGIDA